jgi:hypothetical protein
MTPQRWRLSVCLCATLLLIQHSGRAQNPAPDALKFFKNYFGTIDYIVGGKGLEAQGVNGVATGTINMSGAPADAEALSAFLYWQVVSSDGSDTGAINVKFNGQPLSSPGPPFTAAGGPLAVVGDPGGTSPCWSSGGGTGNGGVKKTYTYRADVLRFIPVLNGRHQINGAHTVELPDSGNSNNTPRALGASLVVIYRLPDPAAPMNAVVIYDGSYTMNNDTGMVSQTIKGYYDPTPGVAGQITYIAGSGQANKSERLVGPGILEFNPFTSAQGASWDNVTRATASPSGDSFTTAVDHQGLGTFDCLTFGAMVYRTRVNDADGDGLLNIWESSQTTLYDPNGEPLPNLYGIANPNRKDIFVEVNYFETTGPQTYNGVQKPQHTHRPTPEALRKVGEAFAQAPVTNPDSSTGISVHFDVGNGYPNGVADPYVLRGALARGGEVVDETTTACTRGVNDPPWVCQFPDPGTVGWKSGFRFLRDAPLTLSDDACDAAEHDGSPATDCDRRFDRNRKDMFRYVLFAHALGVPKADCLVTTPGPNFGFPDETCQNTNPLYHVPATNTGVGDFLGGDALVTLGAFDNNEGKPVGSDYGQAATLMHEIGHGLGLRHGGDSTEANCKPNYLSVMNYLFQLRGLRDSAGAAHVDFSGQNLGAIDERFLGDPANLTPAAPYKTGWYAPQGPGTIGSPATKHCDGTPLLAGDGAMVRVDSDTVDGPIDWNKSDAQPSPLGQDLNFDGVIAPLNAGFNDWAGIRLNQLGTRRNVGGWFWVPDQAGDYFAFIGPLSLDVGRGDLGRGDLGRGDLGRGDLGRGDLGRGDLGRGDLGRGDLGRGDLGRGDLGRGDLGRGDLGRGDLGRGDLGIGSDAEVNSDLAAAGGYAPPNELTATVVGLATACSGLSPADCHRIRLHWLPPDVGTATQYRAYRIAGLAGPATLVGTVPAVMGQTEYSLVDTQELPNGQFTYYVAADFGPIAGGPSNSVVITAVNERPVAGNESYSTNYGVPLVIAAPGVLTNDTDIDSPTLTARIGTAPLHGTVTLNANGSFTYTPAAGFVGTDSFTYTANDADPARSSLEATVTITVNPIVYGFVNVQNVPPPANKTFKRGSTVALKWQFTLGGVVVDSTAANPEIRITGPGGVSIIYNPQEPGHSEFKLPTAANGWTWQFNWQTVYPQGSPLDGTPLPEGNYTLTVTSRLSGQTFPVPAAVIKLSK